jgi:methylmalonyl-CoA mutase N-terminal domain/subunit
LGGSYSIETLSKQIAEKSWELFQQLDEFGGMFNADARAYFRKQITQKANIRKAHIQTGKKTLIGVNKFHNPQTENNQFLPSEQYLDMNPIIFERDLFES